ncbi:hypothetical protein Glove_103g72 [Diversispora epigaea]|uniref:Uncharacterized protein n=1 Tax=Diversispora epigaea TaxID=1348612 RepID=A0A397J806_9GLOM|nr:hypothetical protein Glove_103g72 [Diversispora epigaea]
MNIHKLYYACRKTPINFNGQKIIPIPKLIKDLFQINSPLPKRFSTISFNWNSNKDLIKIPINQKQNPNLIFFKNRKNYISPSKSILFNSHIISGNSRIKIGFPFIIKSCNNTIRSFTSKPPLNNLISPPSNDLKKLIALCGAILTFFYLKKLVYFVISGVFAIVAYRSIKSFLDLVFPRNIYSVYQHPQTIQEQKNQDLPFKTPFFKPFSINRNSMVDRLYESSIKQIQMAYDNNHDDFKYQLDGYIDSSSSIEFFEPHSVSSRSIVLGTSPKENSVTIEYWMSGITGNKVSVKAIGNFDQGDLNIKDIIVYWPHTGKKVKIPTKFEFDGYKSPTQSPKIFEAEYRDIKKE